MLTDDDLRKIHHKNQGKVQPSPAKIRPEKKCYPCKLCGVMLEVPGPEGLSHKACIQTYQEDAMRKARTSRSDLARVDLAGALASCGVPAHWLPASLDNCPDIQAKIGQLADWCSAPSGILYLSGCPGAGKTWAAVGCLRRLIELGTFLPEECLYVKERAFLESRRAAMKEEAPAPSRAARIRLLLFDDLGASRLTDWGRDEVAGLIEVRHGENLPTIITSNIDRKDLARAIDGRVSSRIGESKAVIVFPTKDLRLNGRL